MAPNITVTLPQPYNKIGDGPEGPEVRIMTDHLYNRIHGCTLTRVDTIWEKLVTSDNWQQGMTLLPAKILDVTCKAKLIYWTLACISTGQTFYLTCTVIMTGKWLFKPGQYTKAVFCIQHQLSEPTVVTIGDHKLEYQSIITPLFFDNKRALGKLIFKFDLAELNLKLKEYGPDLLQEDVKPLDYINRVRKIRSDTMGVCKFLLEQRYFSGIGNYLKSEALYHAGIHPTRTIKSLSDVELTNLLYQCKRLIRESYLAGGVSISDYESPVGVKGQFKLHVYQQHKTDPGVQYTKIDGRGTYWK